jgi:predicted RNase H-like nuclease (RuvC/YqgF family)
MALTTTECDTLEVVIQQLKKIIAEQFQTIEILRKELNQYRSIPKMRMTLSNKIQQANQQELF